MAESDVILTGYGRDDEETRAVIGRRLAAWYASAPEMPVKVWTEFYYNSTNETPRFVVFADRKGE